MSYENDVYWFISWLIGVVTFLGGWAYAIATYGWFLGGGLGWIPAAFIGVIVAFVWPFIAAGIGFLWWQANH